MGFLKSIGQKIFGGGSSSGPGMAGTGRFKGEEYQFQEEPFRRELAARELEKSRAAEADAAVQRQRLVDRATGKAPSLAAAQLKAASERNLAGLMAGAQASRGGSAAARERLLARQAETARRATAQQAVEEGIKERAASEKELADAISAQRQLELSRTQQDIAARQQEIDVAEKNRAALQELERLRGEMKLGAQGLSLSGFQSAAAARQNMIGGTAQALMSAATMGGSDRRIKKKIKVEEVRSASDENNKTDKKKESISSIADLRKRDDTDELPSVEETNEENKRIAAEAAAKKQKGKEGLEKAFGQLQKEHKDDGVGKAAASRAMSRISDEQQKKSTHSENSKSDSDFNPRSFLDALKAYSYEYKDPEQPFRGKGRFLSPMAQDLENAGPVGRSMVQDTPHGKIVDYGKGFGAILAAQAHLNERLAELEKQKKGK